MPLRNPLSALLDYASQRGNEASSIGSVMTQLARPILVSQGVETGATPPAPQAKTGGGVPAAPLPKTTSDAQEYYIREIQKRGMSRPVAEGIVAGMGSESGLDPTINERDPVVPGSRGGFGLYQLTGPRRIAFERWASENGKDINKPEDQLDFMMSEFAGPERKAYDALIQSPDAQSAATVFTDQFLRPGVSHSAQSANEAARMSGQPYDPAMAGAGAMAATGGALPQTVEGILSSLYPDSTEAEKTAHRKDIWRGLSQGLSAMSQGRPVDLSNIAANADERRRQYVLDAKEREKAKVAASMVYSQSGDANLAAGIASGAISYSDYLNDRQVKNAERIAQEARLKDAATTDALYAAAKAAGVSPEKLALIKTGDTAALTLYDKMVTDQQLLDKQAKDEEKRTATLERLGQSADPLDQATFAYMVDADLSFAEARKLAQTDLKPETLTLSPGEIAVDANTREVIATGEEIAPDMTAAQNEANDLFTKGAVNPDTQKPFTSYAEALVWKLNSGKADTNINVNTGTEGQAVPAAWVEAEKSLVANGQMFVRKLNPDTNQFDFVLGEDGMPTIMDIPGGKAAADVAATEAKTAQIVQQTDIDAATSPLELQALRDTLTKNALDIEQQIANAPDQQAELKARAAKAETDRLQAELNYKEALSMEGLTAKEREVALEKANAERDNAVLTTEKLSRELADSETGKQAGLAASLLRSETKASSATSAVADILKLSSEWKGDILSSNARLVASMVSGSDAYDVANVLIPQLDANNIITNIDVMKKASPTGATGFGATTKPEIDALKDLLGKLDIGGDPALLRKNLWTLNNYILDSAYGTQEQLKANPNLTEAEKEFYGQRYDIRSGQISRLGTAAVDEGVITMWSAPPEEIDASQRSPEEQALIDKANAIAAANAASGGNR
jgi:hypothetical protein